MATRALECGLLWMYLSGEGTYAQGRGKGATDAK